MNNYIKTFNKFNEAIQNFKLELGDNAKKWFLTGDVPKEHKIYGDDLYYKVPPVKWNKDTDMIEDYGINSGTDIFVKYIKDNMDSDNTLIPSPFLAELLGIPSHMNLVENLEEYGSGLNNNEQYDKHGTWQSALYDVYIYMNNTFL